jgi:O-antigen/teichoic acid export membrane protein
VVSVSIPGYLLALFAETFLPRSTPYATPFFIPPDELAMQNYVILLADSTIAAGDIAYSLTNYAALISAYFWVSKDYHALIFASILAFSVRLVIFLKASMESKLWMDCNSPVRMLKEIWEARRFIKFNFPCNILNTASVQLPPGLINLKYSEGVVGLFSMARNIADSCRTFIEVAWTSVLSQGGAGISGRSWA